MQISSYTSVDGTNSLLTSRTAISNLAGSHPSHVADCYNICQTLIGLLVFLHLRTSYSAVHKCTPSYCCCYCYLLQQHESTKDQHVNHSCIPGISTEKSQAGSNTAIF